MTEVIVKAQHAPHYPCYLIFPVALLYLQSIGIVSILSGTINYIPLTGGELPIFFIKCVARLMKEYIEISGEFYQQTDWDEYDKSYFC